MPLPMHTLASGQQVKLGRIRPVASFDFGKFKVIHLPDGRQKVVPRLGAFYDVARDSQPPPVSTNWRAKAAAALSQMYGNDQWGNCVIASKFHQVGLWTGNEAGTPAVGTTTEAVNAYHSICGAGDNGCIITDVLDIFKTYGLTIGGKTHKIDNYVSVDWTNKALVQVAIEIFGSGCVGINLPNAWTCTNCTWDVTNTRIVGGHDVPFIDYDASGVYIATWAGVVLITWAAFMSRNWIEEAYVELSPDWYANGNLAPNGIDVAALQAAFAEIANGQVPPIPAPPAPPTPTPTPTPTPPTPTPTPTPTPPTPTPVPPTPTPPTPPVGGTLNVSIPLPLVPGNYALTPATFHDPVDLSLPPIIQNILAYLEGLVGAGAATINWTVLRQTAITAFQQGGTSAVLPALANSVSTWCTGPQWEQWVLKSLLVAAEPYLLRRCGCGA